VGRIVLDDDDGSVDDIVEITNNKSITLADQNTRQLLPKLSRLNIDCRQNYRA